MAKLNEQFLFDKRIVRRNVQKGIISKQDLDSHVEGLSDMTANVELISFDQEEVAEEAVVPAAEPVTPTAPTPTF